MADNRGGVDCDLGLCFVTFSPRQTQTVVIVTVVTQTVVTVTVVTQTVVTVTGDNSEVR